MIKRQGKSEQKFALFMDNLAAHKTKAVIIFKFLLK